MSKFHAVRSFIPLLFLMFGVVVLIGCGSDQMPLGKVQGRVTVDDGTNVEGGRIIFTPTDGGPGATGKLDASGNYTLTTYAPGDGAVVGKHQVSFIPPVVTGIAPPPNNLDVGPEVVTPPAPKFPPAQYLTSYKSGLTATVVAGENPPINFELKAGE